MNSHKYGKFDRTSSLSSLTC